MDRTALPSGQEDSRMSWKLMLALALALAWLPASSVRAQDEPADQEAAEPAEEPAEKSAEPAQEEAAEEEEEPAGEQAWDRDGWYLGLGGGYAKELFSGGDASDGGFMQIRAGYHFLRFAALEAQFEYSPKFNGQSGQWNGVDIATWATWLNIKGYPTAPWTAFVQPFGMIGIAWMWERLTGPAVNNSIEEGGFASRFGGGLDVYVTRNIMITAEAAYVLPTGELDDLNQVQIGGALQYRW
jgi:opacity protein-like surface antigen